MTNAEPIRILAVGDIMTGDSPVRFGFGGGSELDRAGVPAKAESLKAILGSGDVVIGNLEVPIRRSDWRLADYVKEQYLAHPETAKLLQMAGFNVLNVANNHILQHGPEVFSHTVASLRSVGLDVTGRSDGDSYRPAILNTRQGYKVAVFGISLRPEIFIKDQGVYSQTTIYSQALRQFESSKVDCDLCIVNLHWGWEYLTKPAQEQREFAENLYSAGADIIIGHHPHVLQPIDWSNGCVTAYSLGNFVFDMWRPVTRLSAVLQLQWDPAGGVTACEANPIYLDQDGWPKDASSSEAKRVSQILAIDGPTADKCSTLDPQKYRQKADRAERLNAYNTRFYFLRHLFSYRKSVRSQAIRYFFARRWARS